MGSGDDASVHIDLDTGDDAPTLRPATRTAAAAVEAAAASQAAASRRPSGS